MTLTEPLLPDDPDNKLATVRAVLHQVLAEGLGDEAAGELARVIDFPIGNVDFPAVVISAPVARPWLTRDDDRSTMCSHIAACTLLLLGGNPLQRSSWELLESWATRLQPALDRARSNELWDPRDGQPTLDDVGAPENIEYASKPVLAALATVSTPINP